MTLALASFNPAAGHPMPVGLSHDIRATLAIIALHVETLERLAGPHGAKAASAAHGLVSKAAGMCSDILSEAADPDAPARRTGFDIVTVIRQVADLLGPLAPRDLEITVAARGPVMVLGSAQEVFRILFNLAHNAVMVARRTQRLRRIAFTVERAAATVVIEVSDDGPGLPKLVRAQLFSRPSRRFDTGSNGFGLAIARELAERNGGTLEHCYEGKGTTFTLVLAALATMSAANGSPVTRLLGRAAIRV
jgi:signal transduction histidine kinase